MSDLRVVAFMRAKDGQEERVRHAVLDCVQPSRSEDGCLSYLAHTDQQDARLFVVIEHWASASHREEHLQSPHFKRLEATVDSENRLSEHIFNVLQPLAGAS